MPRPSSPRRSPPLPATLLRPWRADWRALPLPPRRVGLMVFAAVFFAGVFYAAVLSKVLPGGPVGGVAAAVAEDRHYCLLVPLTVEVFIVWTICHWMFSKIHRHAYC